MLPQKSYTEKEIGDDLLLKYRETVSYIEAFSNVSTSKEKVTEKEKAVFIERTRYLLGLVGNPEKGMDVVHVTGTAGKGSTAALIHAGIVRCGLKAGLFMSPYVTTAIENITVNGTYIAPEEFVDSVSFLKPHIEKTVSVFGGLTAFEIYFVVALLYFKSQCCSWAVIEVGVGGRFDPTNVVEKTRAAVITGIDYDHTDILGKTLLEIARDKAGIIKKGAFVVCAEKRRSLVALFKKECDAKGAYFCPVLHGKANRNVVVAQTVLTQLNLCGTGGEGALCEVRLPCRFEIITEKPLVILDGAHNRAKMKHTADMLVGLKFKRLIVVIGISGIKPDTEKMLPVIIPQAHTVIVTSLTGTRRRLAPVVAVNEVVQKYVRKGAASACIADPREALRHALALAAPDDCILVTGSFFLAGELRKDYISEQWILSHRKSFKC